MLFRLLAAGLLAGVLAGLAVAALQHVTTVPLILQAEVYETAAAAAHGSADGGGTAAASTGAATTAEPAAGGHDHGHHHAAGEPMAPWERTISTSLATVGTAVGFAFMLLAAMAATGETIDARSGLAWGMAAFLATGLAPALGLAPQLPGAGESDLAMRQAWWLGTAAATAAGLWLALRPPFGARSVAGLALLAAPHLVGAPRMADYASTAPAELAAQFAASSLVVHAVLWLLIGLGAGLIWQRQSSPESA